MVSAETPSDGGHPLMTGLAAHQLCIKELTYKNSYVTVNSIGNGMQLGMGVMVKEGVMSGA